MLVKIIAAGLDSERWKDFFRQLRLKLPDLPFSVGVFASPGELEYLREEFFPNRWRKEAPDFFLCGVTDPQSLEQWLTFLERVREEEHAPRTVLVTDSLETRLREIVATCSAVRLTLDKGNDFSLSDPAFLLKAFPPDFPRLKVNDRLSTLRIRDENGVLHEIEPHGLDRGTLVGFSEVEAILQQDKALKPREWLKALYREEGIKRAPRAAGLIREAQGLYLFPGIPLEHIRGLRIGKLRFDHLIGLNQLEDASPQFSAFREAFRRRGNKRARTWKALTARIRQAEAKADIPVVCGGRTELLRESMAALLQRQGYQRCHTLDKPVEGVFREPSLLLQVASWERGKLGAQSDSPVTLDLAEEFDRRMKPLDTLLPWRELAYEPPPADIPTLPREQFTQQRKRLAGRASRLGKKFQLEEKRDVLLTQEVQVLLAARDRLSTLLNGALQTWTGEPPAEARQVLLLSHDKEEAAAVMGAMPHIAKKRWFDLAPFAQADAAQNLSLDDLRHYGEQGVMLITPASREKLETQHEGTRENLETAQVALTGSREALEQLGAELSDVEAAREKLARHWVWEMLGQWLKENRPRLLRALDTLRERHERRWFSRSQVRRALIIPYRQENAASLLDACEQVYPGFNRNLSVIVPYEFDFMEALAEEDAAAIREQGREEGLAPGGIAQRLKVALGAKNEAMFADFLHVVSGELIGTRMDLVLVEHSPDIAPRILEHVRRAVPQLEKTPAVLILSGLWRPPEDKPLPWPRTRVVLLPHMGALDAGDCSRELMALYSQ